MLFRILRKLEGRYIKCKRCTMRVRSVEIDGVKVPSPHCAPCGAKCAGGGLSPEDLRLEGLHGLPGETCPSCGIHTPQRLS